MGQADFLTEFPSHHFPREDKLLERVILTAKMPKSLRLKDSIKKEPCFGKYNVNVENTTCVLTL